MRKSETGGNAADTANRIVGKQGLQRHKLFVMREGKAFAKRQLAATRFREEVRPVLLTIRERFLTPEMFTRMQDLTTRCRMQSCGQGDINNIDLSVLQQLRQSRIRSAAIALCLLLL